MRKLVTGLFVSLDGVAESPDQWQFDVFDADMGDAMIKTLAEIDAAIMGRVTYEEWSNYWPTSDDQGYAPFINNAPKYVVSTTLQDVSWGSYAKPTLIRGNLTEEIAKIKALPGKNIGVQGSITLVRSLVAQDLLDELMLLIHPVVVGKGKHLFADGAPLKRLKLVDSRITGSGVAILTYHPRRD